ncbi:putative metal-dependent phosphoesterase (PHP family) [Patulibacter medicamentivorans]|uniref:Putative metal-dependent phosphoesterase (PHP family) n=1 Tax=Patulibacter medicamentivorans TaxID=1097667 RepID=H0E6V2_9ACTN|nr:PHP domain-containing protein [Patulibacter medicamentivorans]EHN10593.1 putative metal-dependent phosphoesterase (PHP family) [Patulibacter medicamentivorans]
MGERPTFDLQAHSTASDGALSAAEVVRAAHAAGVRLLSLTDHDSVAGVQEALETAAGLDGIEVVPGIEVSAIDGDRSDLHVCGYGIDHRSPPLLRVLEEWRADRAGRGDRMVAALRELGWAVDERPLAERRAAGGTIGRPHVAAAAFDHPDNAARVRSEGLATATDLLVAYLIPGAPAYRERTRPTVAEAIEVIHAAGGVAVWAHPYWDIEDPAGVRETLERFAALGLDGVEAFYVTFSAEQTRMLVAEAERLGLLTTGSADFHGPRHPSFSRFRAFDLHGLTPRLGPIAAGA